MIPFRNAIEPIEQRCGASLSVDEFKETYYAVGKPVHIKHGVRPCAALEQWSWTNLREYFEPIEAPVPVRKIVDRRQYRAGQGGKIMEPMRVGDYLAMYEAGLPTRSDYYLAHVDPSYWRRASVDHGLLDDLPDIPYIKTIHRGPFVWIGPQNHYEFNHTDSDDNLLVMVKGKKRCRLFSPQDDASLYPLLSAGYSVQSAVDLDDAHAEITYPQIVHATCYETILEPGDCLYIPVFWWHQVTSLTDALSINFFMSHEDIAGHYWARLMQARNYQALCRHLFVNIVGTKLVERVMAFAAQVSRGARVNPQHKQVYDALVAQYGSWEHLVHTGNLEFELCKYHLKRYGPFLVNTEAPDVQADIHAIVRHWQTDPEFQGAV